jgi:hypothetical protein
MEMIMAIAVRQLEEQFQAMALEEAVSMKEQGERTTVLKKKLETLIESNKKLMVHIENWRKSSQRLVAGIATKTSQLKEDEKKIAELDEKWKVVSVIPSAKLARLRFLRGY